MCSCRTYVPHARLPVIPGFELRAALRERSGLMPRPAALAPSSGRRADLGPVDCGRGGGRGRGHAPGRGARDLPGARSRRPGPVQRPRTRGRRCAALDDPASRSSQPSSATVFFETEVSSGSTAGSRVRCTVRSRAWVRAGTRGPVRQSAVRRALRGRRRPSRPDPRRRRRRTREFLSPLSLGLLPLDDSRQRELRELGIRSLGQLAELPRGAVERTARRDGRRAWSSPGATGAAGSRAPTARGDRRAARVPRGSRERVDAAARVRDPA